MANTVKCETCNCSDVYIVESLYKVRVYCKRCNLLVKEYDIPSVSGTNG